MAASRDGAAFGLAVNEERWRRVEEIFAAAADLPDGARAALLDARCGADAALRDEVETLLRHDAPARSHLEAAIGAAAGSLDDGDEAGRRIGPWRLVRELGRGGMGSVWLGERVEGAFAQTVAVKLVRRGMDAEPLLERFRKERQILAGLVHPNVARLFDGGTTGDGRPYFVMEYVDGRPLTEFGKNLSVRDRLKLFLSVCDAVAYAHRNLVVHRDLKPSNILVTADGVPKLLDFGIAKLVDPETGATRTVAEMQAFTPEYASPEQVKGEPITTAADVYALGVVLYELLTGVKAQPVTAPTLLAIHRAVCETEPARPSVAAPGRRRELSGDLDDIVMTALRKEPDRRYPAVAELADDLRHHLSSEPVRARKGTFAYRAGRFVKRNRVTVAAGALVAASLVAGIVVATWQARERAKEARRAERRFAQVRNLATSFLFEFHDKLVEVPGTVEARGLIAQKALENLDALSAEAGDDAQLKRELADAYLRVGNVLGSLDYSNLGRPEESLESARKAITLFQELLSSGTDHVLEERLLSGRLNAGVALAKLGRRAEATGEYRRGLAISRNLLRNAPSESRLGLHLSLLNRLGDLLLDGGDPERALQAFLETGSRARAAGRWSGVMTSLARVGLAERELGDLQAALSSFEAAAIEATDRSDLYFRTNLCLVDADRARTLAVEDRPSLLREDEAVRRVSAAVSLGDALIAGDSKNAGTHAARLEALLVGGEVLSATATPREGLELFEKARGAIGELERLAPGSRRFANDRARWAIGVAVPLRKLGRAREARERLEEALATLSGVDARGPSDVDSGDAVWTASVRLGDVLVAQGDGPGAAARYREALALARARTSTTPARPMNRFFVADAAERLARALAKSGVADERGDAIRLVDEAASIWQRWRGSRLTPAYADARLARLVELRVELGRR